MGLLSLKQPIYRLGEFCQICHLVLSAIGEAQSAGFWRLSGGGPCENFVVRAAWFNQDNKAVFFTTFDGKPFEKNLTVCP